MPDPDPTSDRPHQRTWVRRVRMVVLCLVAGAIINVLVAWGCAYWSIGEELDGGFAFPSELTRVSESERSWLEGLGPRELNGRDWAYGELSAFGITRRGYCDVDERWLDHDGGYFGNGFSEDVAVTRVGWPFRSLKSHEWIVEDGYFRDREYEDAILVSREFDIGGPADIPRPLPLRPIPLGLLANTVSFAVVIWAALLIPFSTRRTSRHTRGLCPACAYDLRGATHEVCPECGE